MMNQTQVRSVWMAAVAVAYFYLGGATSGIARGQTFFWDRTGQTAAMSSAGNVVVTVNGTITDNPDSDSTTSEDMIEVDTSHSDDDPSLGGGGGDGGSGARAMADGDNGADGDDGTSLDGANGPNFATSGGLGGDDGTDGVAEAAGDTVGELELNANNQAILSWSFIHNQNASLDLTAGGGGAESNGACFLAGMAAGGRQARSEH